MRISIDIDAYGIKEKYRHKIKYHQIYFANKIIKISQSCDMGWFLYLKCLKGKY